MSGKQNYSPSVGLGRLQMFEPATLHELAQLVGRDLRKLTKLTKQASKIIETPADYAVLLGWFHLGKSNREVACASLTQVSREGVTNPSHSASQPNCNTARQYAQKRKDRARECILKVCLYSSSPGHWIGLYPVSYT